MSLNRIQGTDEASRPDYLRLRALIEAGFNDMPSAERDLKQAMALAPNNVSIALNYANLLWKMNRDARRAGALQALAADRSE